MKQIDAGHSEKGSNNILIRVVVVVAVTSVVSELVPSFVTGETEKE